VKGAAEIGADLSLVARRAVDGAIEAGKEVGGNAEEIAKVAVGGAIEAAASVGTTAARAVSEMLVGVVEGVREVAGAAFPAKGPAAPESPPTPGQADKAADAQQKTKGRDARGRFK
jgi:hypothetical protein